MTFSVFTYNTLFNRAVEEIKPLILEHQPDVLCLQEVKTDEANLKMIEKFGLKLADFSNSFIKFGQVFGVATFYNPKKLRHVRSTALHSGSNLTEILFQIFQALLGYNKPKTFLKSDFVEKTSKKDFSICNIHLYVVGSNALRLKHIKEVIQGIETKEKTPLILAGDFNYFPYLRRRLENLMKTHGFKEATKNIFQTIKFTRDGIFENFNLFQRVSIKIAKKLLQNLKIDYIFYRNLKLVKTERIEVRFSDHFPIISYFSQIKKTP